MGLDGTSSAHQTAQGHQAILELSADGSIVPGDSTGVKHGSAYRRRAGDGLLETGTDKPSRSSNPAPVSIGRGTAMSARLSGAAA
jgi:hypothetical protein